jgi:TetR/AcrR family transcriptional regulator, mexJK operon transcriptional repressor
MLRAATSSFLEHGYRSSVDEIARRAGVAKQTVYSHFPSKEALFKEVARELAQRVLIELDSPSADLREGLQRFSLAYRERALGAQGISAFRTLVPEVPRFRAHARAMYANSAGEMVRRLAGYLERAMDEGQLRRDDPHFAAEMLLSLLAGLDRMKRLFAVNGEGESEARRTARIVDLFLRAYQK